MMDRALLQSALHALEKHALTAEAKLIQAIRDQLKRPPRDPVIHILGEGSKVALEKLNSDLRTKRSRRKTVSVEDV